jgi:hypothetical protein
MSRQFPPPRSRPRSPTARALEIVRLTKRPRASSGGWRFVVKSQGFNISPDSGTPRSGVLTLSRSKAPGARGEAMGAEIPAAGVPQPATSEIAPVTSPDACGRVPFPPLPQQKY